jgi:hypothetical protein
MSTKTITVAGGGRRSPEQVEVPDLPMHLPMKPDAPRNCPSCESPDPALHPAVQHEGEVQPCSDGWHRLTRPGMEAWSRVADCAVSSEPEEGE